MPPTTQGEIKLTSVFAAPIAATEPVCTPEPDNQRIYGTYVPFNSANPEAEFIYGHPAGTAPGYTFPASSPYTPSNWRSRDDVVQTPQAGANNDLCFGFTLTPNLEPKFQSVIDPTDNGIHNRLQNDPPLPDVAQTHVGENTDGDDLKNAVIDMPAGFAGAVTSIPTCSPAQFGAANYLPASCPPATMAGTVFARLSAQVPGSTSIYTHLTAGGHANPLSPADPYAEPAFVYNLEPEANDLARLGVSVKIVGNIAPAKFVVRLVLTPEGRVRAITENAPRRVYKRSASDGTGLDSNGLPTATTATGAVYLEALAIRAWGAAGAGNHPSLTQPFAEWGTNCTDTLHANVSIETYAGTKSSMESNGINLTGCESLPFLPSVSVTATENRPAVPTGVEVKVDLGQTTTGPKTALLKDAAVTLPAGLEIGAQVGSGPGGLPLCSADQFSKGTTAPAACPAGSKVGDVNIVSPLVNRAFVGSVYLGAQAAVGELPALYIEAAPTGATSADAPRIKLIGEAKVDDEGHLTTTFKDAPQLRFSQLRLTFPGGPNALFSTPRACGTTSGESSLTSWASATPVKVTSELAITDGCDLPGFAPSFSMSPANPAVGASSPTKVTISREDRSPWLKDVKVSLPAGFLADLKLATECSKADAAAAACPESSRMGSVTTVAGVGESPLALGGSMYLVDRDEGSVAGAVIVVRAKIGDLDLGNVVVPARIDLRPSDAGLVLSTSAPLRFKGIALNLRSIIVDLDRENFPLNPTACGPLRATAELVGDGGQTAAPTSDVTYTGCGNLPFEPSFSAKLSGEDKPKGHPQLDVTMIPRAGDSNLKSARVVLPVGVASDPANIKIFCTREDFDAGKCADNTKVGSVTAQVSITNDVIAGSIYLVRIEGTALPGLGMSFSGRYSMRVLSSVKIDKNQRLVTEFASIPDVPIRRLDLTVAGGAKSPIINSTAVCKADTAWEATLSGQGGQTKQINQAAPCKGLAPTQKLTWSVKTGLKLIVTAPSGRTLKSAKVSLPKGFKFTSSKSSRKKYVKGSVVKGKTKGKDTIKTTSTSMSLTAKTGPTKVTFTAKSKGYVLPKSYKKKLKKKKKLSLKTRIVLSDGTVTSKTLTVKTK